MYLCVVYDEQIERLKQSVLKAENSIKNAITTADRLIESMATTNKDLRAITILVAHYVNSAKGNRN